VLEQTFLECDHTLCKNCPFLPLISSYLFVAFGLHQETLEYTHMRLTDQTAPNPELSTVLVTLTAS